MRRFIDRDMELALFARAFEASASVLMPSSDLAHPA
jgi:hypothetical protein